MLISEVASADEQRLQETDGRPNWLNCWALETLERVHEDNYYLAFMRC